MSDSTTQPQGPTPDPALRRLDFLVGRWSMRGHLIGSDEENIVGETAYEWLPGGFFMRQRVTLDFAGFIAIESEEILGYDPASDRFKSLVFSNLSPDPLPYEWDVREDGSMTIRVSYGPLDATFEGRVSEDGNRFSGGWRPNPGADESINIPYDIAGERI
jgi:Protein of unknown function (DUF1579)